MTKPELLQHRPHCQPRMDRIRLHHRVLRYLSWGQHWQSLQSIDLRITIPYNNHKPWQLHRISSDDRWLRSLWGWGSTWPITGVSSDPMWEQFRFGPKRWDVPIFGLLPFNFVLFHLSVKTLNTCKKNFSKLDKPCLKNKTTRYILYGNPKFDLKMHP